MVDIFRNRTVLSALAFLLTATDIHAQSPTGNVVPVTADNFIRAESDLYMDKIVKDGAFGKFIHRRGPASLDNQTVIRLNRDTLYSSAVFDLDAGPAKITLPNAGKRFMSMQVINEDHYIFEVDYGAGNYNFTKAEVGTRLPMVRGGEPPAEHLPEAGDELRFAAERPDRPRCLADPPAGAC